MNRIRTTIFLLLFAVVQLRAQSVKIGAVEVETHFLGCYLSGKHTAFGGGVDVLLETKLSRRVSLLYGFSSDVAYCGQVTLSSGEKYLPVTTYLSNTIYQRFTVPLLLRVTFPVRRLRLYTSIGFRLGGSLLYADGYTVARKSGWNGPCLLYTSRCV